MFVAILLVLLFWFVLSGGAAEVVARMFDWLNKMDKK